MALLDYFVDVISVPDIADLSGCLILCLERDTVFLLKVDYNGIHLAVLAKLDGFIKVGTGSYIKAFYLKVLRLLNILFRDLGERAPVTLGKLG